MIAIHMKDMLDAVIADESLPSAMNLLNMAAAQGKTYQTMDDPDGGFILVNIHTINYIKETD